MARHNTRLESEGAEFLVLGNLLIAVIPTFKAYTQTAGYDLISTNPEKNRSCRVQVKSRWRTNAGGFIIKRFDCDFVVVALLNRGARDDPRVEVRAPDFYVVPVAVVEGLKRGEGWGKISFSNFPNVGQHLNKWDLIRDHLGLTAPMTGPDDEPED